MGRPDPSTRHAVCDAHLRESLRNDFSGAYLAINELLMRAEQRPASLTTATVTALDELLTDPERFAAARQRYFLFRQTAQVLTTIYTQPSAHPAAARLAREGLFQALMSAQGPALRAVAEALGNLPVKIPRPPSPDTPTHAKKHLSVRDFDALLDLAEIQAAGKPYFMGRSLILPCRHSDAVVAVKLARSDTDGAHLAREGFWLHHLAQRGDLTTMDTHIPSLLLIDGKALFRLKNLPVRPTGSIHPSKVAIAFKTKVEYFSYPNDSRPHHRPGPGALLTVMARNAHQMGVLASRGILHTAPIPLFHNRIQRHRRHDAGRYQWFRAGRLDRWLTSCAYPNFGLSGLRDFEHLEPHRGGSQALFRAVGTHFLSFLLVSGAYFRSADPQRVGLDSAGRAIDARDLFDPELLERLVRAIFHSYYRGFTGTEAVPPLRSDLPTLCERMITEMGLDRHMVEILRAVDQKEMEETAFKTFLREGGMPEEVIARQQRGAADIELISGPHLGNFNRQISLPELTDAVGAMAALCMAGRHASDIQRGAPV